MSPAEPPDRPPESPAEARSPLDLRRASGRGFGLALLWPLALVLAAMVVLREDWEADAIDRVVQTEHPIALIGGLLLLSISWPIMGMRWRSLIPRARERGVSPHGLGALVAVGQLLNVTVPGPVGEVAASVLVRERYGVPVPEALAASLHARLVGVATAATVALSVWALFPLEIPDNQRFVVTAAASVVGLVTLGLVVSAARPRLLMLGVGSLLGRLGRSRVGWLARFSVKAAGALEHFVLAWGGIARQPGLPHLQAFFWTLCGIASEVTGALMVSTALGFPAHLPGLLFTHCAVLPLTAVLFAFPAGQLGWDAAKALLLTATARMTPGEAALLTVVLRLHSTALLGGAMVLLRWILGRRKNFQEAPPP